MSSPSTSTQKPSQPVGTSSATEAQVFSASSVPDPTIPSQDNSDGIPTYYRLRARTLLGEGKIACPIAAKPGSQTKCREIIQVYLPIADFAVDWQSWRKIKKPQIPKPFVGDPNLVLMSQNIDLDGYEVEGEEGAYYISAGTFKYVWKDRSQMTLSFPLAPFYDVQDKSTLVLAAGDFVDGIINAGWPNPAAASAVNG